MSDKILNMRAHLYRPKGSRVLYGWYYDQLGDKRRQVRRSTGCTDMEAASAVLAGWERDAANPHAARQKGAKLSDAIDLLIEETRSKATSKHPTRSTRTIDFQETAARPWYLFAGMRLVNDKTPPGTLTDERRGELATAGEDFLLSEVTPGFVDAFIRWRRGAGVSEYTISKNRTVLRPAMRLAKRDGLWDGDLDACFPRGFELHYKPGTRWATIEEARKLLAKLPTHHAAALAFAFALGAEPAAVWRAKREDVTDDKTQQIVRVRGTKRATRDRPVPVILDEQRELLAFAVKHATGTEGLLFAPWLNMPRDLSLGCTKAKIDGLTFVDARRSFAHWLKDAGVRQEDLAVAMGHSSMRMLDLVYGRAIKAEELLTRFTKAAAERTVALRLIEGGKAKPKARRKSA